MIHKATKEIYAALKGKGLKAICKEEKRTGRSFVSLTYKAENTENAPIYGIFFNSENDCNNVAMRAVQLLHVEQAYVKDVLREINRINKKYRYVKFVLDGWGDIGVKYDFSLSCEDVGECAFEMTVRFVSIITKVYPELKRAAGQEDGEQDE